MILFDFIISIYYNKTMHKNNLVECDDGMFLAPPEVIAKLDHPEYTTAPPPANIDQVKIEFGRLSVLLTRRCNQPEDMCPHCICGEPQSIDLDQSAINAFFRKNRIAKIVQLVFFGGETSLNGRGANHFSDQLTGSGIPLRDAWAATNGLLHSVQLAEAMAKLNSIQTSKYGYGIIVSTDNYHVPFEQEAIKQYQDSLGIGLVGFDRSRHTPRNVTPMGRAVQLMIDAGIDPAEVYRLRDEHIQRMIREVQPIFERRETSGEIVIEMPYTTELAANGKIGLLKSVDYATADKYALFDVRQQGFASALYRYGLVKRRNDADEVCAAN